MHALVTGGAGFIGSNLVDALLAAATGSTVLDNLSTGKRENLTEAVAAGATAARARRPRRRCRPRARSCRVRPEVVFHLAAQIDVRLSVHDPAADATSNALGTINVLQAALAAGTRRVVNTSTGGRAVRRRRHAADAGGPSDPSARAVRDEQVGRRGLLRAVHPPPSPLDGLAALRERLRAPPGRPWRGRCGGDLLWRARRRADADGVRRWPPDPGLGRRRRRRPGQPARRGAPRSPARSTSGTARRPRCSTCSGAARRRATTGGRCPSPLRARAARRGPPQLPRCDARAGNAAVGAAVALCATGCG